MNSIEHTITSLQSFLSQAYAIFAEDRIYLNRETARWREIRKRCEAWLNESTVYHFMNFQYKASNVRNETLSRLFEELMIVEKHMVETEDMYLNIVKEPRQNSPLPWCAKAMNA